MSWQLASFAVLALALAAGFAWYERAQPSAKLLALVATLAALAALGRVAFAPLPSVKPTTDIVLIAGYALGGAPGFVVGAVGALASNVFFGQGPFTPWQMAGWGAVGVFGALLARVFGRDLGRWPLAAACALAGLAYGSFLDLHLWVLYSAHSWEEYLLVAGRGVPFNLTHAGEQRRLLPRLRAAAGARAGPLPRPPGGGLAADRGALRRRRDAARGARRRARRRRDARRRRRMPPTPPSRARSRSSRARRTPTAASAPSAGAAPTRSTRAGR